MQQKNTFSDVVSLSGASMRTTHMCKRTSYILWYDTFLWYILWWFMVLRKTSPDLSFLIWCTQFYQSSKLQQRVFMVNNTITLRANQAPHCEPDLFNSRRVRRPVEPSCDYNIALDFIYKYSAIRWNEWGQKNNVEMCWIECTHNLQMCGCTTRAVATFTFHSVLIREDDNDNFVPNGFICRQIILVPFGWRYVLKLGFSFFLPKLQLHI